MVRVFGIAALFALACAASNAIAGSATIGNVSINLPPPLNFCELSANNASDKRMITTLTDLLAKSGNKLLVMSADCRQLAERHAGKRQLLDDYAQYQTPIAGIDKPPTETIQQTCATLRAEGDKILSNQIPDIKKRVEATLNKIKMNEANFLGVLAEDANACYAGILQKIHTEANTDKTQITVFAIAIVKTKSVFVYRFAVYTGSDSIDATLVGLKSNVAALYAAN
jgi:hypothetical protein